MLLAMILAATPQSGDLIKLFRDKDAVLIRAPAAEAVPLGTELDVCGDAQCTRVVGKALVVEVKGGLLRLTLDDEAQQAKGSHVRVPRAEARSPTAAAAASPQAAPRAQRWPPLPVRLPAGNRPRLPLTVKLRGDLPILTNHSKKPLTGCRGYFSDGRRLGTDGFRAEEEFDPYPDPPGDLLLKCEQGQARFPLGEGGAAPGSELRGHAELRFGSVTVYNDGPTAWTGCELRLPGPKRYMLSALKGEDRDSVRVGLFSEIDPRSGSVFVTCDQGESLLMFDGSQPAVP